MHYMDTDKRLDEWVLESSVRLNGVKRPVAGSDDHTNGVASLKKRKRSATPLGLEDDDEDLAREVKMSEEEYDIEHHKQITAKRNFDKVNFGKWQIKTWSVSSLLCIQHLIMRRHSRYFSPYPLIETEMDEPPSTSSVGPPGAPLSSTRIPGVSRSTVRSHGRTSDLLAGGLGRSHGTGEKSTLWVCDKCFKYMTEGLSWELHVVRILILLARGTRPRLIRGVR